MNSKSIIVAVSTLFLIIILFSTLLVFHPTNPSLPSPVSSPAATFLTATVTSPVYNLPTPTGLLPVLSQREDECVIPDKYNTGVSRTTVLTKVTPSTFQDFKSKTGLPVKTNQSEALIVNFKAGSPKYQTVLIENMDFSSQSFLVYNSTECSTELKISFNNCRFKSFDGGHSSNISYEFHHCSFESVGASYSSFYNCYIGSGQSDGLRFYNNVFAYDCYISDKSQQDTTESAGNHTDGIQIFGVKNGSCGNIHLDNCRFEMPQLKNSSATVNACIMLQIEFCDADNIVFSNCYVNGGGYSVYAWSKNNKYLLTNAIFENVKVGCSSHWGSLYSRIGENVRFINFNDTSSLYVSSVWLDSGKTHISVTNDTSKDRTLIIYTDCETKLINIPACPCYDEIVAETAFDDFPFDIPVTLEYSAQWVVCYDLMGDSIKQIRCYNPSNYKLYLNHDGNVVAY